MKWGMIAGISLLVALIGWFEWPKAQPQKLKKEKFTIVFLLLIGWSLALFDLPNLAGPTTIVEHIFKPLGSILEGNHTR